MARLVKERKETGRLSLAHDGSSAHVSLER